MPSVTRIRKAPANLDAFVEEIAPGMARLYGEAAGAHYRNTACASLAATIGHPAVGAYAFLQDETAAGLCFVVKRTASGHIAFIHVLASAADRGIEKELAAAAVRGLREEGFERIVAECIPFCRLDLEGSFVPLGFERVPRLLMAALLTSPGLRTPANEGRVCTVADVDALADVLVDAYREHPGRGLHTEVRSNEQAAEFLRLVFGGGFGAVHPGYVRAIDRNGQAAALIIGCEVAAQVGFVLQVAVRRRFQGRGLGRQLMRESAERFRQRGMERMALGVTRTSPALRLYGRLGFKELRAVDVYVWRRGM